MDETAEEVFAQPAFVEGFIEGSEVVRREAVVSSSVSLLRRAIVKESLHRAHTAGTVAATVAALACPHITANGSRPFLPILLICGRLAVSDDGEPVNAQGS